MVLRDTNAKIVRHKNAKFFVTNFFFLFCLFLMGSYSFFPFSPLSLVFIPYRKKKIFLFLFQTSPRLARIFQCLSELKYNAKVDERPLQWQVKTCKLFSANDDFQWPQMSNPEMVDHFLMDYNADLLGFLLIHCFGLLNKKVFVWEYINNKNIVKIKSLIEIKILQTIFLWKIIKRKKWK